MNTPNYASDEFHKTEIILLHQKADCISGGCIRCSKLKKGECRGGYRDPRIDKIDKAKAERIQARKKIEREKKQVANEDVIAKNIAEIFKNASPHYAPNLSKVSEVQPMIIRLTPEQKIEQKRRRAENNKLLALRDKEIAASKKQDLEATKKRMNENSKKYYQRNKEKILQKTKERNKKKKRRQSIEMENYLNSQKELIYSMLKDDATIKKIAEATGVSSKTISKYMSESEILKPKKKN